MRRSAELFPVGVSEVLSHKSHHSPEPLSSHTSLLSHSQWPQSLDEAALHGLAGDVMRTIAPHTECAGR